MMGAVVLRHGSESAQVHGPDPEQRARFRSPWISTLERDTPHCGDCLDWMQLRDDQCVEQIDPEGRP